MSRKLIPILAFIFLAHSAQAQLFSKERLANLETFDQRFLTWGYFLGFNQYDFKIEYEGPQAEDIVIDRVGGFNVGLIGDMRLNEHMNLRLEPGLYFTQRDIRFPGFVEERDILREVKSTYIHVPLLLKVSTKRLNNFKPFIVGGVSSAWNLSSNSDNPQDNSGGEFRMESTAQFWEVGFGIDFYLFYFKFTPSIRGVFAMNNELIPDNDPNSPWTGNISSMGTRGIFINFTFQ